MQGPGFSEQVANLQAEVRLLKKANQQLTIDHQVIDHHADGRVPADGCMSVPVAPSPARKAAQETTWCVDPAQHDTCLPAWCWSLRANKPQPYLRLLCGAMRHANAVQGAVATIRAKDKQLEVDAQRLKAAAATKDRMHVSWDSGGVWGAKPRRGCLPEARRPNTRRDAVTARHKPDTPCLVLDSGATGAGG